MRLLHTFAPCLFIITQQVLAQQNTASRNFFSSNSECPASLGGWKCLTLDLSSQLPSANDTSKVYKYSWDFGDGTRIEGASIEHCYKQFGSYQIALDLIDPETNTVIRSELSSTIHLFPEIQPSIVIRSENLPPSTMEFTCAVTNPEVFEADNVYWKIDDQYYTGPTVLHSFTTAGVYTVEVGIEKNIELIGTATACTTTKITIKESDVWTSHITSFINSGRSQIFSGPYVKENIYCLIIPTQNKEQASIISLNTLMSHVNLLKDPQYELMLFSGNIFTASKFVNTRGIPPNNMYRAFRDTVSALVEKPLTFLKAVSLKADQKDVALAESYLKENAACLLANPYFKVEVGSYMHTGSRFEKGVKSAILRAKKVKESLVRYGVPEDRISIASPSYNRALTNICTSHPDCLEHEAFNDKVEIKIVGVHL